MKPATKCIFTAIGMEILAAIITSLILLDKFNIAFVISISPPIIPIIILAYFLGQKVNYKNIAKRTRVFLGVLLIFTLLYSYIILCPLLHTFYSIDDIISTILLMAIYTTMLGGVQTFIIGLWLGYKLSKIKE